MALEEEESAGIPEWVVTFGDMMSLLLTFFIMLVSLSEIKEDELYQAVAESMRRQFGNEISTTSIVPGDTRPRNSKFSKIATMGRARRFDTHRGGDKVSAPAGDNPRVRIVRPGTRTTVGTVIIFPEGSAKLTDRHKRDLQQQALELEGKPQKIEVRGHTSLRPVGHDSGYRDNWDLAYQRCRNTVAYLGQLGVDPERLRMSVAGPHEPVHAGTDQVELKQNPRVEVFLLDEVVNDLHGTEADREKQYADEEKNKGTDRNE